MGPLFSLAILFVAALAVSFVAYVLARVFRVSRPFFTALSFSAGVGVGGAAAVVLAACVIGIGATLTSSLQVAGYLCFLCVSSLVSGALAVWCCRRVLTIYSTRTR